MCGIFGLMAETALTEENLSLLRKSHQTLCHRGPDAHGEWISANQKVYLAHHRLAIVDLDPRSHQPMRRGNLTITFNGEIYNFRTLKTQLQKEGVSFTTDSDTEVILALFKREGIASLQKLRGMFSFGIFDENSQTLFLARDRIGEKPLVYAETTAGFLFASEIPAILESGFLPKKTDEFPLSLYFSGHFRHVPGPLSLWRGIKKLEPASFLIVKEGKIIERKFYWHMASKEYQNISPDAVKNKIIEAVRLTTVADVPIALLLSGGTDSSIIAWVLKKELRVPFHAFAFGKDEQDEEIKRAKRVAQFLEIPLTTVFLRNIADQVLPRLQAMIQQYGEPVYLMPLVYADMLFEEVRKRGFKVVLTGSGADEIFFGYLGHRRTLLLSYLFSFFHLSPFWVKKLLLCKMRDPSTPPQRFVCGVGRDDRKKIMASFFSGWKPFFEHFHNRYYIDFSNFFGLVLENAHSITMLSDIAGMKNSLEVRCPFLDHQLVEMAFQIHPREKVGPLFERSGAYQKAILKKAFENDLPKDILYQPKLGFGCFVQEKMFFPHNPKQSFGQWAFTAWKRLFLPHE